MTRHTLSKKEVDSALALLSSEGSYAEVPVSTPSEIGARLFGDLIRTPGSTLNGHNFNDFFPPKSSNNTVIDLQQKRLQATKFLEIPSNKILTFYRFMEVFSQEPTYLLTRLFFSHGQILKDTNHQLSINYDQTNQKITLTVQQTGPFVFNTQLANGTMDEKTPKLNFSGSATSTFEFDEKTLSLKHVETALEGEIAEYYLSLQTLASQRPLPVSNPETSPPSPKLLPKDQLTTQMLTDGFPLTIDLSGLYNQPKETQLSQEQLQEYERLFRKHDDIVAQQIEATSRAAESLDYDKGRVADANLRTDEKLEFEINRGLSYGFTKTLLDRLTTNQELENNNSLLEKEIEDITEAAEIDPIAQEQLRLKRTQLENGMAKLEGNKVTRSFLRAALQSDLGITNEHDQNIIINMILQFSDPISNSKISGGFFHKHAGSVQMLLFDMLTSKDFIVGYDAHNPYEFKVAEKKGDDVFFTLIINLKKINQATNESTPAGTLNIVIGVTPSTPNSELMIHPPQITATLTDLDIISNFLKKIKNKPGFVYEDEESSASIKAYHPIITLEAELEKYLASDGKGKPKYEGSNQKISDERKEQVKYLQATIAAYKKTVVNYEKKAQAGQLTEVDRAAFAKDQQAFMAVLLDIQKEHKKDTYWWHTSKLLNKGTGDRLGKLLNRCLAGIESDKSAKFSTWASLVLADELAKIRITPKFADDAGLENISAYAKHSVKRLARAKEICENLEYSLNKGIQSAENEQDITKSWNIFTQSLKKFKQLYLITHKEAKELSAQSHKKTIQKLFSLSSNHVSSEYMKGFHKALDNGKVFTAIKSLFDAGFSSEEIKKLFKETNLLKEKPEQWKDAIQTLLEFEGFKELVSSQEFKMTETAKTALADLGDTSNKHGKYNGKAKVLSDIIIALENLDDTTIEMYKKIIMGNSNDEIEAAKTTMPPLFNASLRAYFKNTSVENAIAELKIIKNSAIGAAAESNQKETGTDTEKGSETPTTAGSRPNTPPVTSVGGSTLFKVPRADEEDSRRAHTPVPGTSQ